MVLTYPAGHVASACPNVSVCRGTLKPVTAHRLTSSPVSPPVTDAVVRLCSLLIIPFTLADSLQEPGHLSRDVSALFCDIPRPFSSTTSHNLSSFRPHFTATVDNADFSAPPPRLSLVTPAARRATSPPLALPAPLRVP
jgi:hypothetical protein